MIPALIDGVLPEGVHSCTFEELAAVFGRTTRSDRRARLTEKFRRYVEEARSSRIALAVVVDGSYVTAETDPNDIDLVLVLRSDIELRGELRPMEYNVLSRSMVRRLYDFDVLPAVEGSRTYKEYIELFSQVKAPGADRKSAKRRKGLLRIEL